MFTMVLSANDYIKHTNFQNAKKILPGLR